MKKTYRFLAGAAALGLCFSFAACNTSSASDSGSDLHTAAYTYLAIDINPSIELLVRENKVVGVKAGNDDASVLLSGEDFTGMTVEEASEKIVALAEKMGYLNEKAEVNSNPRSKDERTVKKLQAENPEVYKDLTPAKVRIIEAIMEYDSSMTYEKGAGMKVSELADMLEDLADEYEDMVTDEVEDKFESRYDEAKAEIERRIAAVYGEEYLAAWDRYAALETAFDRIEDKAENVSLSDEDVAAVMELLGISDRTLLEENGAVTPDSVDDYLDKHFDDDKNEDEEEENEDVEDAVEDILDKYDEDEYALTEEDLAALSAAAGETLSFKTIEDAEEYLDEAEEALDDLKDSVKLTEEQKEQIKALKEEIKALKNKIREEMKAEIEAAKEQVKRQKEEKLG